MTNVADFNWTIPLLVTGMKFSYYEGGGKTIACNKQVIHIPNVNNQATEKHI